MFTISLNMSTADDGDMPQETSTTTPKVSLTILTRFILLDLNTIFGRVHFEESGEAIADVLGLANFDDSGKKNDFREGGWLP